MTSSSAGDSSSGSPSRKSVEMPIRRCFNVSPMPASTSDASFAQALFRGLCDRIEHGLGMLPERRRGSQQPGIRSFSSRDLYCSMDSSVDFLSCFMPFLFLGLALRSPFFHQRAQLRLQVNVRACSTPCIICSSSFSEFMRASLRGPNSMSSALFPAHRAKPARTGAAIRR